jgi:hypothetical protein
LTATLERRGCERRQSASGDQNGAGLVTSDATHARAVPSVSPTCARRQAFAMDAIRALCIMRVMVRTAVALTRMKPAQPAVSRAPALPQNDTPGQCPADARPTRQWLVVLIVGAIVAPVALQSEIDWAARTLKHINASGTPTADARKRSTHDHRTHSAAP